MEFGLSEEQKLLADSLNGFLGQHFSMDELRASALTGLGYDETLWKGLIDQGIGGLLVSDRFGGSDLSLLDAAVVAECLGYHATAAPFTASLALAPWALRASGTETQQEEWLPKIATGEVRIGLAFAGGTGQVGVTQTRLEGNHLTGQVAGALDGGAATHFIVYLPDGHAALAAVGEEGVTREVKRNLDRTRPLTELNFENARVTMLNASNDPKNARTRVLDAGRVLLAADTLGAAQSMFDKALAYSKERVQFNRVIGSFQGVKYSLADMVTDLEPCRSLVWFAAYAQDAMPEESRVAALHAKAHLGDVGRDVARLSTEVYGGMGFTDLVGLHYWLKRIALNRQLLGAPEHCRHEAGVVQGWCLAD
jgi:alkylation response protein AidB-like acyl-CoA dehydrogenase